MKISSLPEFQDFKLFGKTICVAKQKFRLNLANPLSKSAKQRLPLTACHFRHGG